jgi:hypothetical protein
MKDNPFAASPRPQDHAGWQVCADLANLILDLQLARDLELVDENGQPNVPLCCSRLAEAQRMGILPRTLGPVPRTHLPTP